MAAIRSALKTLGRVFVVGLITAVPFFITFAVLYWLISGIDGLLGTPLARLLPHRYYIPGMGLVATLIIILATGVVVRIYAAQKILAYFDGLMSRIPIAKMIYGSTKDVVHLFSRDKHAFNRVVLVGIPNSGCKLMGLVTRDGFDGVAGLGPDMVSVYIPISYQIGGYMMLVPRAELHEIDMTVEEAIRLILTAGVSTHSGNTRSVLPVQGALLGQSQEGPAEPPAG